MLDSGVVGAEHVRTASDVRQLMEHYAELRDVEQRFEADAGQAADLVEQLDAMESKVEKVVVPLSYTDELYALRNNIHLVRKKLLRKV